ncbi:MAG: hypothetical protein EOP05_22885 [Proteobacteria bacterium]|nr:MAG: hypothetical protein EOP05_22885 [Pseudomonadota bacterium]
MKLLASAALGLTLLSSGSVFAMGQSLPKTIKDELVSRAEVQASFNLRAEDGSVIALQPNLLRSKEGLKNLPAERRADYSKCGKSDVETVIALSDIALRLAQETMQRGAQAVALSKQDLPEKLSVVKLKKSYAMQLKMKSGRTALFQISSKLDGIKNLRDLERVRFDSSTTGQNIGIRFAVTDKSVTDPTRSRGHESCTVFETIRGKTVARPGHRRTVSQTTFTSYSILMTLTASNGTPVFTAELGDGEFDTITRDGTCYAD